MTAGETERPPDLRATLALRSGAGATLRCLRDDDAELLGAYFARLSPRTRDFYGPHRFDQETADRLCEEARTDTEVARFVATVTDGYQAAGVGSAVMGHLVPWLRGLGRRRLVLLGGVQQRNGRAIAFYRKWGFRIVGDFETRAACHDMIATL